MSDNQIKASSAVREDGVYGASKNSEFDYLLSVLKGIWYNHNMKHIPDKFIGKLDEDKRTNTRKSLKFGSPNERFKAKWLESEDGCHVWVGATSGGYGLFAIERHSDIYAHRYAYEAVHGKIGDDLQLDHLCRNTKCVNPDHLEPVTPMENILRSEGQASINARKTHCKYGHDLADAYVFKDTPTKNGDARYKRACRTCWGLRSNKKMTASDLEKKYGIA